MTAETLSIAPQSELDSSQRKLAHQEKVKYLLAEANIIMNTHHVEPETEQIVTYIEPKELLPNKKSTQTPGYWVEKFAELEKLINKIPESFREKFKNDLPEDLTLEFEAQLSMLLS